MANFNFNKVILGGRLTSDPELRQNSSGIPVMSFTIAVTRRFGKSGEQGQVSDFINCVAWRNNAEFISRFFKKGNCICVVGNLQTRTWQDQQGQKRYATEVIVDEVNFVESKSESSAMPQQSNIPYNPYGGDAPQFASDRDDLPKFEEMQNDDDLPF